MRGDGLTDSVFLHLDFYLLLLFSLVGPAAIYVFLYRRRKISRPTVFAFGILLILMAGMDLVLLRRLEHGARISASLFDDRVFVSEVSVALYLLPALFAGVGINLVSHVLIGHLVGAEARFERERRLAEEADERA